MNFLVLFITCIASWVTLIKCLTKNEAACRRDATISEKCLPDKSGFDTCHYLRPYVYRIKSIHCKSPQSSCRCFENRFYDQKCQCVNPKTPPSFPPTGVIRWNGTLEDSDRVYEYYGDAYIPGEVHKDSNGRYLMKKTNIAWSDPPKGTMLFEIIIPNEDGAGFTKYNGDERSKICTKREVNQEGSLSSIWKKLTNFYNFYYLAAETLKKSNIYTQVWKREQFGDSWTRYWNWTVEYNKEKDYAIPKTYHLHIQDGFNHRDKYTNLNYFYEPIAKDEESFQLEDYCSDVKK